MKKNGSITVFTALALMLTAAFLFALLEAGYVYCLSARADLVSELGIESVCAEFQPELWNEYGLLCLDGAYGGEKFSMEQVTRVLGQRISKNLEAASGGNIFHMQLKDVRPVEYQLLTDEEGSVFLKQAAGCMREKLPAEIAEKIYQNYLEGKQLEDEKQPGDSVADAKNAIEDAKREQFEKENGIEGNTGDEVRPGKNENVESEDPGPSCGDSDGSDGQESLLDIVMELKQNAVLGMVVENPGQLSDRNLCDSDNLMRRECEQGTMPQGSGAVETAVSWYEKLLALEYLDEYFSDYTDTVDDHALCYEMEYVLCGKPDDRDNLSGVASRLLLAREAANIVHIVGDQAKRSEALLLAETLAGFTGNPAVVKVVQIGIVAAWAYLESIQDVRALLQGDRIALIKNREQWTTQAGNMIESFQNTKKAKHCPNGLSYRDYLKQFLFIMRDKTLAFRMLDIMEQNIRHIPAYSNCRMDHMICKMAYRTEYAADARFSRMCVIGRRSQDSYLFTAEKSFSYLSGWE